MTSPGGLTSSGEVIPPSATPSAPTKTRLLRDGLTQDVNPSPDGNGARFYNPEDGRFYRVNPDGTITLLADKQFFNVANVSWGNTKDEAVLEFPDGSNVFYDFAAKRQVVLPSHWEEFNFSNDDSHIAAKSIGLDPDNRFLLVSNPDGTEAKAIAAMGDNASQVMVNWSPNGQVLAFSRTGEAQTGAQEEIYLVGPHHENYHSLIAPGQGFLPSWSPSGKQLAFSVWNAESEGKPNLWVVSGDVSTIGANRKNINLKTWADKCAWAGDTDLYCGVPQNLPPNSGLSRREFATLPDDVYHVDLATGASEKISTADQTHPVMNPVVNRDSTKLIFTDAETGKLYSYDLK